MEYASNQVSKMSGVSARTLRYYDEIGLLKPARIASSGYRIYGQAELSKKRERLDTLIETVTKSLAAMKGEAAMSDKEKFTGFKQAMIEKNERQYGAEIREKYGEEVIERSNMWIKGMSRERYVQGEQLRQEMDDTLKAAFESGDPSGELAQKACELHGRWLAIFYPDYNKVYHKGLGELYVSDERFKAYYEKIAPGCAEFLRKAINIYCAD